MCYDHLFHSRGNDCSERCSGLLAAMGLVSEESSSNPVRVAPLLCSLPCSIHACILKRDKFWVIDRNGKSGTKETQAYMGGEGGGGLESDVQSGLCRFAAWLRAIPVGSAEPAQASHLSQALRVSRSVQDSGTDQALGTPGAECPGNPEERTRWLRRARDSGPHAHLRREGSGLPGHPWLPAWLLPALQPLSLPLSAPYALLCHSTP